MWRESFEFGLGIKDPHPIAEQERYFWAVVEPNNSVRVAIARVGETPVRRLLVAPYVRAERGCTCIL
jgi:hypothetical protein